MSPTRTVRAVALALGATMLGLLTACAALKPAPVPPPRFFSLGGEPAGALAPPRAAAVVASASAPSLLVNLSQAAAGFDSQRIIYTRQPFQLEYFSRSEWVDTPARMLAPLMVSALDRAGSFRAVLTPPTSASADLRLDTEIVRLQHEFGGAPSRVRLTLRATLTDNATRQVLAQIDLDQRADAGSEDAYGGVVAANAAASAMLQALVAFCTQVSEQWRARDGGVAARSVGRL